MARDRHVGSTQRTGLGLVVGALAGTGFTILFLLAVWPWIQDILGPILRLMIGIVALSAGLPFLFMLVRPHPGRSRGFGPAAVLAPAAVVVGLWLIVAAIGAMFAAGTPAA